MGIDQSNNQEDKTKSFSQNEYFEYINKIYSKHDTNYDVISDCTLKETNNKISEELHNRRCLLEREIIGNCKITDKLLTLNNPISADRIYKLSATDLFVEKAINLLNDEADKHEKSGKRSFKVTISIIVIGALIALSQMLGITEYYQKQFIKKEDTINPSKEIQLLLKEATQNNNHLIKKASKITEEHNISQINENVVKAVIDMQISIAWKDALMTFTKSFTFYGLLVLSAVFLKRQGKASLDQAERIKDKRHALREDRLYIHLKNGQIETIKELEEAFNWNSSQQNAFSEINTEAQAPWGTVFRGITETFTKTIESLMKNKNQGENK